MNILPTRPALAVAALLALSPATARSAETHLTTIVAGPVESFLQGLSDVTHGMLSWLWPSPNELAGRITQRDNRFQTLMASAGYGMKEVKTSIGLIPRASATFQLAREMSELDIEDLERQLDQYESEDSSPIARFQRLVVLALVDAPASAGFRIDNVEITILPLPQASFTLVPTSNAGGDQLVLRRAGELLKSHFP
ncbi:MAG: hypothetical protein K2X44_04055 [Magnetospirillum sp.]|nr:hypothetical protein [Magnetospirillum sp.]